MNDQSKNVEHKGIVTEVKETAIKVNLIQISACSACHAKNSCGVSQTDNKIIEVLSEGVGFSVGDEVTVVLAESLGFMALLLGYLLPFVILTTALIFFLVFTKNELISGLGSIGVLVLYYGVLIFFRKNMKQTFTFQLKRIYN